jgi:pimeloyl-ACP methyl ester carboxylesterase
LPSPDLTLAANDPIPAEQVVAAHRSVDALTVRAGTAYWLEIVGSIDRPVLFAHGRGDPVAPVDAVQTMADALGSGCRDRALFFEHDEHPVGQSQNRVALLIAAARFLEDVLSTQQGQ